VETNQGKSELQRDFSTERKLLDSEYEDIGRLYGELRDMLNELKEEKNDRGVHLVMAPVLSAMVQLKASANQNINTRLAVERLETDIRAKVEKSGHNADDESVRRIMLSLVDHIRGDRKMGLPVMSDAGGELDAAIERAVAEGGLEINAAEAAMISPQSTAMYVVSSSGMFAAVTADGNAIPGAASPPAKRVVEWKELDGRTYGIGDDGAWYPVYDFRVVG
jgi:hypothetical protein